MKMHRSIPPRRILCWALVCHLATASTALGQISIEIINQNPDFLDSEIYFMFGGGGTATGTINGAPIASATNYSLDQQGSGILLNEFVGGKMLFAFEHPLASQFPNFQAGSGGDATTRWDKVEITYFDNPALVSVTNLSATDFFGIPLEIRTYAPGASTPSDVLTWTAPTATVFTTLGNLSGNDAAAVVTGAGGVTTPAGDVLRVISPSTVPPGAIGSYTSFQPYIDAVKTGAVATQVKGHYSGGGAGPFASQDYDFTAEFATVNDPTIGAVIGDLVLKGEGTVVGPNQSVVIKAADLDAGIYTANPDYLINDTPAGLNKNDVYGAAVRDILGGFNLGFVDSDAINPNTGNMFKNDPTDDWYGPLLSPADAYSFAQPIHSDFFNQYSAYLSTVTDAYGFPYNELIDSPLATISPPGIDRMEIIILSDLSFFVPEPSAGVYAVTALLSVLLLQFLRKKRAAA